MFPFDPRRNVTVAAVLLLAAGCSGPEADPRPSILLVVIDTLRADAVSAYGSVEGTTPNLDDLAERGLLYRNAFAPAPWTLPSHATLFTGLDVTAHGVGLQGHVELDPGFVTIAERLRDAGYRTAGFSENVLVAPTFGLARGFEHFGVVPTDEMVEMVSHGVEARFDVLADLRRWSESGPDARPGFVFVNLYDPHEPYGLRPENRFLPEGVSAAAARLALKTRLGMCDDLPGREPLDVLRALYLGDVAAADAKLAELRALVRAARPGGKMITVVTSDHGEHLGEHGLLGHEFTVYDVALRVPLVVHGLPGEAPSELTEAVGLANVAGSILSWAGVATPEDPAPLPQAPRATDSPNTLFAFYDDHAPRMPEVAHDLQEPTAEFRKLLRAGCAPDGRAFGDKRAIVRGAFKLIDSERQPPELYDLSWDPGERSNLAVHRPELVDALRRELDAFDRALGAAVPQGAEPSPEAVEALRALGYLD